MTRKLQFQTSDRLWALRSFVVISVGGLIQPAFAQSPGQSAPEKTPENGEVLSALPSVRTVGLDPSVIENARAGDAALRLQLLETYEELHNWEMTEALARLILEKEGGDNVVALRAVADAFLRMKKGAPALSSAARLAQLDPSPKSNALHAQAMILVARHGEAADVLTRVKADLGNRSPFQWQEELAFALFHSGRTAKATKAFKEIVHGKSYSNILKATATRQLRLIQALEAQHWIHQGEDAKAITILEKLKRSGGATFEYQEDLGYAYQNAGRLRDARQAFEEIRNKSGYSNSEKSNARDQINLLDALEAEQLKEQGDYEQALSLLNRLKRRFRNAIFPFQDQLAFTLAESGDIKAAREVFEEIANNQSYPADQRTKARLEIEDMKVDELLSRGYAALEGFVDWRQARQIDALLMSQHSSHPDAIGYHASILSLSGRCEKAIVLLERLRDAQFSGKQFPQAGLLAECYYQVGRFDEAKTAYREAFETPEIEAREQIALRDSYRGFRKEAHPSFDMSLSTQKENDDRTLTTEVAARVPFGAGWAIGADYKRFDTDGNDSQEVLATVEKNWGPGFYAQVKAGTNDGDAAYAATIGKKKRALGTTAWSAGYHNNETADDTSELTADGGRQERASVNAQHDIAPNFRVSGEGNWRAVETDKQDLGSGYDLNFEAAYGWNMANSRQRSFEVAYVADVSSFDYDDDTGNDGDAAVDGNGELIDSDFHRHGAQARWYGHYGRFEPYAAVGGYYRVDEESFEYEAGAGVDFDMREDTTVYLRGQYSSSGEGKNSGEGVVEGQIGVEKTF